MNFQLSPDQLEIQRSAYQFAQASLGMDESSPEEFSRQRWKACADFGLQGILVPEEFGGLGLDALGYAAIMEGVGRGCRDNGLIFSLNAHVLTCILPLLEHGSDEQKKNYLPGMVSGALIGANAMTEPDSGSDVYTLKTVATRRDNHFFLNGSKTFVTNAPVADLFIVYARTSEAGGFFGNSCFLVPRETPGLTVGGAIAKMGLHSSPMAEVAMNNCKLPVEALLGSEGGGGILFAASMDWERGLILANCVGAMERQLAELIAYIKDRRIGDKRLQTHQAVTHKLAEMKTRLETSRLHLYKVAWLKTKNSANTLDVSTAKLVISEAYVANCRDALQLYGGYGYAKEYGIEAEMRDALAGTIYSGTSEIQKNIIAELLL
jgi:alkylation response protein AidB-like acyl-CoA dehydrogenase